mgnify:CR=1 FL=1
MDKQLKTIRKQYARSEGRDKTFYGVLKGDYLSKKFVKELLEKHIDWEKQWLEKLVWESSEDLSEE